MVDNAANVRLASIAAAKNAGDTDYLVGALTDPENRHIAARYLGELGASEAAPQIVRLLDASDPQARANASRALGALGFVTAAPRLRALAETDPETFVRSWAIGALGDLGDRESVPVLIAILGSPSWRTRVAAVYALGLIGDPAALPAVEAARRSDRLRWRYWVLMRGAYRRTSRVLKHATSQPDTTD